MKLYLSSFQLGNDPGILAAIVGDKNKNAAVIANAADGGDSARRQQYVEQQIVALHELGFKAEELDLRDYFDTTKNLEKALTKYGVLWVLGGNSFILRRAMVQSNFDTAAQELIDTDQLVYAGFSAGSCAVTKDLHGLELVDDPNVVPDGYRGEIVWQGMGLVDFSIAPHYRSDHPESAAVEQVVDYFKQHNIPYKTLQDGQVILANNYETKIV
jgi:dipeptidase E